MRVAVRFASRYPRSRLHIVVITKEEEERAPPISTGMSTGELVRRLRDTLPSDQQHQLSTLAMPGPGRKADQLNWALRAEAPRELLGDDVELARVFVGVSDADSLPDPDTFRWVAHQELSGRGALAYQGLCLSLANYDRLDTSGKIWAIQQSSVFMRMSILRLLHEAERARFFPRLCARFPRAAGGLRSAFEFFFRRSFICMGHNQFVRLDALRVVGGFPTSGATEDSTLGYALGHHGILIQLEVTELCHRHWRRSGGGADPHAAPRRHIRVRILCQVHATLGPRHQHLRPEAPARGEAADRGADPE
jgi:hypothetical protein